MIDDILLSIDASVHVKDIKTGKYLDSNDENLKKFGFTKVEQIRGLTILDLNNFMENKWGRNLVQEIEYMECLVAKHQKKMTEKRCFLTAKNRIFVHKMIKIPLVTPTKNKVCGILTISDDITNHYDLISLLAFYKKLPLNLDKKFMIESFLSYIGISSFFHELPTESELMVLLAKQKNFSSKRIANTLNLSFRTVQKHIENLKKKTSFDLYHIIANMRR